MAASEETIAAITAYLRGEVDNIEITGIIGCQSQDIRNGLSLMRNGGCRAEIPPTKPTVPDHVWMAFPWCKAIATDADGEIWAFSSLPDFYGENWGSDSVIVENNHPRHM
jgi:hypothetical protein